MGAGGFFAGLGGAGAYGAETMAKNQQAQREAQDAADRHRAAVMREQAGEFEIGQLRREAQEKMLPSQETQMMKTSIQQMLTDPAMAPLVENPNIAGGLHFLLTKPRITQADVDAALAPLPQLQQQQLKGQIRTLVNELNMEKERRGLETTRAQQQRLVDKLQNARQRLTGAAKTALPKAEKVFADTYKQSFEAHFGEPDAQKTALAEAEKAQDVYLAPYLQQFREMEKELGAAGEETKTPIPEGSTSVVDEGMIAGLSEIERMRITAQLKAAGAGARLSDPDDPNHYITLGSGGELQEVR